MNNAKIVFKISRYNARKQILTLTERYNSRENSVTSMARVMFSKGNFISGLHLAYIDEEGTTTFSFNKKEEIKDVYQNFNISLTEEMAEKLLAEVKDNKNLAKPVTDENGVSLLKGYQLHVELNDSEASAYSASEGSITYGINANQVASVKVVTQGNEAYVHTNETVKISLSTALKATHKKVEEIKEEAPTVKSSETEVLNYLVGLSKGEKRKVKRDAFRAKQKAAKATQKEALDIASKEEVLEDSATLGSIEKEFI